YIKPEAAEKEVKTISMTVTAIIGIVAFLLAISPPDLLVFLNLFAFGGLEAAFIWPLILGLYLPYANKKGAIASMVIGISSYIVIHLYNTNYGDLFGVHAVTVPVVLSFIGFVLASLVWKEPAYFFPTKKKN